MLQRKLTAKASIRNNAMLLRIPSVLTRDQLDTVRQLLAGAAFVDGKLSAGMAAKRVKNNQELDKRAKQMDMLNNIVMGSLVKHPVYRAGALTQAGYERNAAR